MSKLISFAGVSRVNGVLKFRGAQTPNRITQLRKLGDTEEAAFAAFLDQQLAPEKIDDPNGENAVRRFEVLQEPLGELFEYQDKHLLDALVRSTVLRAVFTERQLYEVMVNFWSDHFNIDPSKGDAKWLKVADDRDVIRAHALGKFPAMLRASALSPAMLWYLDGRVNKKANDADKPNENYARELLELHRTLLALRRDLPALANLSWEHLSAQTVPDQGPSPPRSRVRSHPAQLTLSLAARAKSLECTE